MPKVTIPGLKESTGMKGLELLDPGRYVLLCKKVTTEESSKSPGTNWKFQFDIAEGIGDAATQKSGRESSTMIFFENVFVMGELHPEYEKWGHIGVDQLKSMATAMKVPLKGNDIDPESFVGKRCIADIRQKADKKMKAEDGVSPRINNEVVSWTADTGK